jgi:uncharacterized protein DUF3825
VWTLSTYLIMLAVLMWREFDALPELVSYFDDPKVLLYDRRRELYIDIDHILDDNIHRFPVELQGQKFLARQSLVAAKAQTQQRVYRNYHSPDEGGGLVRQADLVTFVVARMRDAGGRVLGGRWAGSSRGHRGGSRTEPAQQVHCRGADSDQLALPR